MSKFITHLEVSINETEEQNLIAQDFKKINVNLNQGAGGDKIYLWYKKKQESAPITRLQVTFNDGMVKGLIDAGYRKIDKNLNTGAGGSVMYLWTLKGLKQYHTPIEDIKVTTDAQSEAIKFRHGWERVSGELNRGIAKDWIHIWLMREKQTYICDVYATAGYGLDSSLLEDGFMRVDEDTNKHTGKDAPVFLWFRQTTDSQRALTDLNISTNDQEFQELQQQAGYRVVSVNLNEGAGGATVYMWYKKQAGNNPIMGMALLQNPEAFKEYEKVGAKVIERNLNEGNKGCTLYLSYQY